MKGWLRVISQILLPHVSPGVTLCRRNAASLCSSVLHVTPWSSCWHLKKTLVSACPLSVCFSSFYFFWSCYPGRIIISYFPLTLRNIKIYFFFFLCFSFWDDVAIVLPFHWKPFLSSLVPFFRPLWLSLVLIKDMSQSGWVSNSCLY